MPNLNLASMFGAIKVNGFLLVVNPSRFFQAITAANIIYVKQPVTVKDINGTPTQCFEIVYQNPKGLTIVNIFLPVETNLANLTDFQSGLTAIGGARNSFTIYNNLYKTSNQPPNMLPGNQSVLINNDYQQTTQFLPVPNLTAIALNQINSLSLFIMYFTGDQMPGASAPYSYFLKTGNS